ncbi:hypothetical protein [Rhodopirellula sp. SWK7]|uniref:hypothetical protein n=1 Tax=Rhodopirellula sp. SWK7 TaxID=595460 RepID=UPI00118192C7|nr:hypothetical protein [Rhodopirellula sp. SWK7]
MTGNPYASPVPGPDMDRNESHLPADVTLGGIARPVFLAWERLRVVYVVLLGAFTLLLVGSGIFRMPMLVRIGEGAIAANLCFFAGPVVETYVRWLGYRGKMLRWFLFVSGVLLSMILVIATLAGVLLPDQN